MIGHDYCRQGLPVLVQIAEFEDGAEDLRIVQHEQAIGDTYGNEIGDRLIERQPNWEAWGGRAMRPDYKSPEAKTRV